MKRKNNAKFEHGNHVLMPDDSSAKVLKTHGRNYVEVRILEGPNMKVVGGERIARKDRKATIDGQYLRKVAV